MIQVTVHYSGRVQGVGFRYTATQTARRFAVAGYAQNLPDGRVRVVAEGEEAEVQAFLDALRERMSPNITDAPRDDAPATGEFGRPEEPDTFTIRY